MYVCVYVMCVLHKINLIYKTDIHNSHRIINKEYGNVKLFQQMIMTNSKYQNLVLFFTDEKL